jgi:hypothetical protein
MSAFATRKMSTSAMRRMSDEWPPFKRMIAVIWSKLMIAVLAHGSRLLLQVRCRPRVAHLFHCVASLLRPAGFPLQPRLGSYLVSFATDPLGSVPLVRGWLVSASPVLEMQRSKTSLELLYGSSYTGISMV